MSANTSTRYFERVKGPAIAPLEENLEKFEAGAITIGVEYRVITDEIVGALGLADTARSNDYVGLNDNGVSVHVFVKTEEGNLERLRFDCFQDDPHYHYFPASGETLDIVHVDRAMTGDPLAWVLERIRSRLPHLLQRAGVDNAAQLIDPQRLEAILPLVTEAAYRSRYKTDKERIRQDAITMARK